jgi:drug/metabolite transporter (DMT)-like permease
MLSVADISLVTYMVWFLINFIIAKHNNKDLLGPKKQRKLLLLRGGFGLLSLLCNYAALKFIDPADHVSIAQSNLIVIAIIARIYLNEMLTVAHLMASVLTLCGVFLISKPTFIFTRPTEYVANATTSHNMSHQIESTPTTGYIADHSRYIGLGITLLYCCMSSIVHIVFKKLSNKNIHYSITTLYATYFGLPVCAMASGLFVVFGKPRAFDLLLFINIAYAIASGLLSASAQMLFTVAFAYEDAAKLGILRTSDVFFSFLFQYFILNITVDYFNVAGSIACVSSVLIIFLVNMLQDAYQQQQQQQPVGQVAAKRNIFKNFFLLKI